jgi:hypothetical protein
MKKGTANVASIGKAACKSRAVRNARNDATASEAGHHRCHGERAQVNACAGKVGDGNLWKHHHAKLATQRERSQSPVGNLSTTGCAHPRAC